MTATRRGRRGGAAAAVLAAAATLTAGCAGHTAPVAQHLSPTPSPATATGTQTGTGTPSATPAPVRPSGSPEPGSTAVYSVTPLPTGTGGAAAGSLPGAGTLRSPSPDVVAVAGLTAYYSWAPTVDTTRADAARRALPWLGGQLAQATRDYQPRAAPGADWNSWSDHHATVQVRVGRGTDDGAPADTGVTAVRQYVLTLTPRSRTWTGPPVQLVDFITITRGPGGWRLTSLTQST